MSAPLFIFTKVDNKSQENNECDSHTYMISSDPFWYFLLKPAKL